MESPDSQISSTVLMVPSAKTTTSLSEKWIHKAAPPMDSRASITIALKKAFINVYELRNLRLKVS